MSSRVKTALVPAALVLLLPLASCGWERNDPAADAGGEQDSTAAGSCEYVETGDASRDVELPPSEPAPAESLTITTSVGDIGVTLAADSAPCTAGSFTSLAEQGFFDDTACHRLTTENIFVLQCGDPTGTGMGGPGYSFADELSGSETYPAGTLAMANAGPDTNGSQFFMVYEETPLPASYTVFGTIDSAGLEILAEVADAGTAEGGPDGAPATEVVIESVEPVE